MDILTIVMLVFYVGSPVYCTIAVIMVERKMKSIDQFNNGIRDIIDLQMQILKEGKNEL